jgi:deoxyadenosine/deoxycytidine kinase
MENLRIGIIGNIGVGKSTLIEALQTPELSNILLTCFPYLEGDEKVHTFQEEFDLDVLDAFYKDPVKHAFMAQIEFLNGRLVRQSKIEEARGIVLEDRTIFEDYHIFGKAQKVLGNMSNEQFIAYQRCYNLMTNKISEPDLVIYLRAGTDVLLDRIKKRGRDSEQGIPADYLELLNNLYETYVSKHVKCPVFVLESNHEERLIENLENTARRIVDKIKDLNLRITTPGIREWASLPETAAAVRVVHAERKLEDYLKKHPKLITVAGNIGMGKSTVTTLMYQSLRVNALYEKPEKNPLLEKFLQDKKTYCYDLQRHFLGMRAELRKAGKKGDASYVKDRTFAEDILVFCQLFHQDGLLTENELDLLSTEFQKVNRELPSADLMIILQGGSNLAWHRIQQRAREMEMNGGWSHREICILNELYKTFAEDVVRCGYHKNPIIKINTNKLDFSNRSHMGYLFEKAYEALQ